MNFILFFAVFKISNNVSMNSNEGKQKFSTIYKITNLIDGRIYIGAHVTCNINDKYMGSSKLLKTDMKKLGRNNFKKEILFIFDNQTNMKNKEAELVNRTFCNRIDTYNQMVGGLTEFTWVDTVLVRDNEGKAFRVYNDNPLYLSGELIPYTKGKVVVKDKEGNTFQISTSDERYMKGELTPVSLETGFQLGYSPSEKTRKQMSDSAKVKIFSEEHKKNLSLACNGEKNGFYNKKHTQSTKDKISKIKTGKSIMPFTQDHKNKIGEANKLRSSTDIFVCKHCGYETNSKMNFYRWHDEKCKHYKL